MNSMDENSVVNILTICLSIMIFLLMILIIVYIILKVKQRTDVKQSQSNNNNNVARKDNNKIKKRKVDNKYSKQSIFDFMEFDDVQDNMIIQKGGKRFVMVVKCMGVNYDLMSQMEKISVEEGFQQFLNTLRHPIQIYIQTRTINLENSINEYKKRVKEIEDEFNKKQYIYNQIRESGMYTKEQEEQYYYELTKQKNLYDYARDIVSATEQMNKNRNVLSKEYYIVISHYAEEANDEKYYNEEVRSMAFSELYTKAQAIIRTLSACSVGAQILTSRELIDLLYVAYNRDEAETYGIDRAIKAGYNELYSTSQDVFAKKIKALDEEIEEKAIDLANSKVEKAKSMLQENAEKKEQNMDELIDELAEIILKDNKSYLGSDISDAAIAELEKDKEENHEVSKKKTKTRNKSAN